jgi:poly-gamma-glutamate synthesis protein (capsule biosynthesis protein)
MVHARVLSSARRDDGTYDFLPLLSGVRDVVSRADLAAVNLETTIGPKQGPFTGYPRFRSPPPLVRAIRKVGFDLAVTANNHCLDGGYDGVVRTLDAIRRAGLEACGTYPTEAAAESILVLERNGIRIAYLAFTYGTNGIPLPKENPRAVLLMDTSSVYPRVRAARKDADLVIVQLHWGAEYSTRVTGSQRSYARALLELGTDLVVGCHPHVVQPLIMERTERGPRPVAYSLGNFLSAQKGKGTDRGALLEADLFKDLQTGRCWIGDVRLRSVFVRERIVDGRARIGVFTEF